MMAGASRGRMPRVPVLVAGGAAALGLAALALLIFVPGVAHATPLLPADPTGTPTATMDPLMVPTIAVSPNAATPAGAISTSSGAIALAITLSCVTTIVGLVVTVATYVGLVRVGYGPFLRALAPRWARRWMRDRQGEPRSGRSPTLRYQPGPGERQASYDVYASGPRARRAESGHARGDERGGASRAPSSRSSRSRW